MSERSQFRLLTERRFLPFFLTQFFGAGNDNVFKFAFTVLATYSAAEWGGLDAKSPTQVFEWPLGIKLGHPSSERDIGHNCRVSQNISDPLGEISVGMRRRVRHRLNR